MSQPALAHTGPDPAAALRRLRATRDTVVGVVDEVNHTTETEVLALGACLERACDLSRDFVETTERRLEKVAGGDDALVEAIDGQIQTLSDWRHELEALDHEAKQAVERSERISAASREVTLVASASKVLSVNAAIEASRAENGEAFMVIASEMRALSMRVERLNQEVQDLARELEDSLPRLSGRLGDLRVKATKMGDRLSTNLDQLRASGATLSQAIVETSRGGQQLSNAMLEVLTQGSSHITFQDPVRQRLLDLDRVMYELEREATASLGGDPHKVRPPKQLLMSQTETESGEDGIGNYAPVVHMFDEQFDDVTQDEDGLFASADDDFIEF